MMQLIYFLLLSSFSYSQMQQQDEIVDSLQSKKTNKVFIQREPNLVKKESVSKQQIGNLPSYIRNNRRDQSFQNSVVYLKSNYKDKFHGLLRGSILSARINESIQAYEGSNALVKAIVTSDPYKGSVLVGNATMDRVTKNINVTFDTFIPVNSKETYKLMAELKSEDGLTGVSGQVHSDYWKYFWSNFALDTAAAAANSATQRTQNSWGSYDIKPSTDSTIKQGISGGITKTVDRMNERIQVPPEFVKVEGPLIVKIAILSQPEINN